MDFDKLGLFYLGKQLDPVSHKRGEVPVLYDSSDLVTHGVIVGMTGSGKTGLGITLMEEAAIDGIPVIAIDPKGDLGNMLLTFPGLSAAEFSPWINPDEARQAGQAVDAFGAAEAARWKQGLADWGEDGARIQRLRDAADVTIYTPGSAAARPLSIVKSFAAPPREVAEDAELLSDRVTTAATSVLTLAGIDAEPLRSREHVLVSTLFSEAWKAGRDLDLASLIAQVQTPPISKIGVLDLESFFPAKDRFGLAMQLNQLLAAPGFAAWLQGEPLDIDRLLFGTHGKPQVSVLSIAHLDDQERMFFVSLLLNELVAWMRQQRGTSSLRALVYFDEIFGFLPPVANPPSKAPMLKLLKQARAFGLGLTVATQNPVDLDYKALSNAGTWFLGRLQTERDKARVLEGLEGAAAATGAGFNRSELDTLLSALGKRQFLLHNVHQKEPLLFETRWTLSYLRGPLGREEIKRLAGASGSTSSTAATVSAARSSGAVAAAASSSNLPPSGAPPVLDPAIRQLFAPGSGETRVPMVVGCARIAYSDAKLGLDDSREIVVLTPITEEAVPVDWERAEPADFATGDLKSSAPASTTRFQAVPPPAAKAKNYASWEKDFGRWAGQTQSVELFKSARTGIVSKPDESERDFRIRLQTETREGRDDAKARVSAKYATKINPLEDRKRRAEQTVQVQREQASGAKMSAAVSTGAAILGALLGRKTISATNIGRVTTAARGMSKIGRESEDVARAQANAEALQQQIDGLHAELEAELQKVADQWDVQADTLDRTLIKPKRGGVSVQLVALAWVPKE